MASSLLSAGVVNESAVAAIPRRDRALIAGCIVLITAVAWWFLFHLHNRMSSSMGSMAMMNATSTRWHLHDAGFTFVMWSVMMVGMMSASAAPVLFLFAGMQARRSERGVPFVVLLFGLGYIVVWAGFSALATLLQWFLHESVLLSPSMALVSPRLASAILLAAGVYQLSPAKNVCLSHCQSPLGFLMGGWRDGKRGALQMGFRHGRYCLGCCWGLMVVLFAVGVMNLVWVALLSVFILVEKTTSHPAQVARIGGALLIVAGLLHLVR